MPSTVVIVASDTVTEEQFKAITEALKNRRGGDVVIQEGMVKQLVVAFQDEAPLSIKFIRAEPPKPTTSAQVGDSNLKRQESIGVKNG